MNKEQVRQALDKIKEQPKRKFIQSYDLVINLKSQTVKNHPLDFFVTLPHSKGRKIKVACFCDQQLREQAKKFCGLTIDENDFEKYKDKKLVKELAGEYDYFIAQSTLMPKVAGIFGKVLGTKGKMPNPKLGCVVAPNASLELLVKKLETTVRLATKKGTNLQSVIGKENQDDNEIIDNVLAIYQFTLKQLPDEAQSISNVLLKLTMGKPVKIQ